MAIEFDGKGNIVGTTSDGVIAVKLYSLEKQIVELKQQLQQKENIIKEVRELIKTGASYCENGCVDDLSINDCNKILEILDKEVIKSE